MQLSVLESRLLHELPEKHHGAVQKEFSRFEMESSRMSNEPDKIGQATLTRNEIERAKTTNQHGKVGHTVIELQVIKAAAIEYNVDDWLSYVDATLSHEENIEIMKNQGNPDNREINAVRRAKEQWK